MEVNKVFRILNAEIRAKLNIYRLFVKYWNQLRRFIIGIPSLKKQVSLNDLVEPDRVLTFKVPWVDDEGNVHVNRGLPGSV